MADEPVEGSGVIGGGGSAAGTVFVSAADILQGFLDDKITAGLNVTLTILNPGGDEQLEISATGFLDSNLVIVSADDTTSGDLEAKIVAGSGITLTTLNPGGNEQLEITSSGTPGGVDGQLQYNNGGVFGGANNFNFNDITENVGIGTLPSGSSKLFVLAPTNFVGATFKVVTSAVDMLVLQNNVTTMATFRGDGEAFIAGPLAIGIIDPNVQNSGLEVSDFFRGGSGAEIFISNSGATLNANERIGQLGYYKQDAGGPGVGVTGGVTMFGAAVVDTGSYMILSTASATTLDIERMRIDEVGAVTITDLSGTGTRMVTADATGILATQAIPAGTPAGADTNIQFNNAGVFGGDSNFTWNTAGQILIVSGISRLIDQVSIGPDTSTADTLFVTKAFTATSGGDIVDIRRDLDSNTAAATSTLSIQDTRVTPFVTGGGAIAGAMLKFSTLATSDLADFYFINAVRSAVQLFSVNALGSVVATDYNGVALTTVGSATNFLNQLGNYVPAGGFDPTGDTQLGTTTADRHGINISPDFNNAQTIAGDSIGLVVQMTSDVSLAFIVKDSSLLPQLSVNGLGKMGLGRNVDAGAQLTVESNANNVNGIESRVFSNFSDPYVGMNAAGTTTFLVEADGAITALSYNGVTLLTDGPATQYLDRTGAYSEPAGGGGGTPGGVDRSVQFNDGGSFGGAGGVSIDSISGDLELADGIAANFGTDADLAIEHNGLNATITNAIGNLTITGSTVGVIAFTLGTNTTATQFRVQGSTGTVGLRVLGDADVEIPTKLSLPDNVIANFGSLDEMEIFHDGTNSIMRTDTGNLFLNNTNATGAIVNRLGGATASELFIVESDSGTDLLTVDGTGVVTIAATAGSLNLPDLVELNLGTGSDAFLRYTGTVLQLQCDVGDIFITLENELAANSLFIDMDTTINGGFFRIRDTTDGFAQRFNVDAATGNTTIGAVTTPDSQLHVFVTSAGVVTADATTVITAESSGDAAISILTPDANFSALYFGSPINPKAAGFEYNNVSNDGMDFIVAGNDRMRLFSNGRLGVGATTADSRLHVQQSSAGTITAFSGTVITVENNADAYISILAPDASARGIFFGEPASATAGAIIYNGAVTDGLAFNVNTVAVMAIDSGGRVGIGTQTPATSAGLEIDSTLRSLLVSRMTTIQRDALTPVDGMILYNNTTNAFNFRENGAWVTGSGLA